MRWFRKTFRPEYWKAYVATFQAAAPRRLEEAEFVVLDTETPACNQARTGSCPSGR